MKAVQLPDVAELLGPPEGGRPWLDEGQLRRRASANLDTGLTRELWKYTPIQGFLDSLAEPATGPAAAPVLENAGQDAVRATPLDQLDAADEARVHRLITDRLGPERHPVADLALLRARGGWFVHVTGEAAEPLAIRYPAHGVAALFLLLEANASLTVVERQQGGGFLAQVGCAALGPGAKLRHYAAALHADEPHYAVQGVHLDRDARYQLSLACVGGRRRRAEVHVVLDGPGASAEMTGAYLVEDGRHLDQQLLVEHRAPRTTSRQKFHGIGAGKGKSVFNGRIHIHPHAPGSDASLTNRNLALHPDAEMNTKPELEIYTDDVRCAHGATMGQISHDALFYLTARGIPEAEARKLLSHGFVRECLSGPLADAAAARFREALG